MRPSPKNLERWDIYNHEGKRSKNGQMEYGSLKVSPDDLKPHTYVYISWYQ
jgi:hypothetical protein